MKTIQHFTPTLLFLIFAGAVSIFVQNTPPLISLFTSHMGGFYVALALLLVVGYGINFIAPKESAVPVFVWAILFGMALQILFIPLISHTQSLLIIIELIATFILFASGTYVPIKHFKKYFAPIATLSVLGTLLSVLLFALGLSFLTLSFGFEVSSIALLILASILASIDPSSILPTLEKLHFKKPFLKDIAISESAINDAVGVIVTRFFLVASLSTATTAGLSVGQHFLPIFSEKALSYFAVEIVWSLLVGMLGAWILSTWGESVGKKHWSDKALFIIVPIFCFALGSLFGGTGFLSAFIAGLLFESDHRTREFQVFLEGFVDRLLKPFVFILLGALTPLGMLVDTIGIGIASTILFMFIIRPCIVFLSLLPWMITKKSLLHWRECIFLSFIRETGAIPAVLLLFTAVLGIVEADFIYAIGLWIILYTLIIEPPLTEILAKKLEIAE
jgi:cell volume regulation protein A